MLIVIFGWLLIGLVVGGLGRLIVPGRNPIGLVLTCLIGIVGSVAGGAVTRVIVGAGHNDLSFVVSLVIAAILVAFISGSQRRGSRGSRGSRG